MDLDELFARRPDDPLVALLKQDIDRQSVAELEERVEALHGEIARCEAKIDFRQKPSQCGGSAVQKMTARANWLTNGEAFSVLACRYRRNPC